MDTGDALRLSDEERRRYRAPAAGAELDRAARQPRYVLCGFVAVATVS